MTLTAQWGRDPVPLKNWVAPQYFQQTTAEATAARANAIGSGSNGATPAAATNSLVFVGITPCRLADTRSSQPFTGPFGPPRLAGGASRTFPIQSSPCPTSAAAQAYSLNLTVVPPGPLGFLTIYPTGQARPNVSTLNSPQGFIVGNAAVLAAGTAGSVDVYVSDPTDLIIDINGYYVAQGSVTLPPGTAGAPALSFSGDPGTGIFSSGPGTLNLSAGGTNALGVDSAGDVTVTGGILAGGPIGLVFPPIVPTDFAGGGGLGATPKAQIVGTNNCKSNRPTWMKNGLDICWDSDLMYVGLKDEGGDRKDSVIAWGDNPASDPGVGPDVLRFIFAGRTSLPGNPPAAQLNGLEVARMMPDGNVGIGTPAPTNTLDVNGQVRVRDLTPTPSTKLVTAGIGGVLGSKAFTNVNEVLRGDGTFGPVPGGSGSGLTGGPCATNLVTKWINTTLQLGCSEITDTGTAVGIDTTTPGAKLDVNGGTTSGINTTDTRNAYMIGLRPVLSIFPAASDNLFVGAGTSPFNSGVHNTFVGAQAGGGSTSGDNNTITGWTAGQANAGGTNAFYGSAAGRANVSGSSNSFFGSSAGLNNQSGGHNTFLGVVAGTSNISGNSNVCVGDNSCGHLTSGNNNLALGAASGLDVTSGNNNIYLNYFVSSQGPFSENNTIRIGSPGTQSRAFVAGVVNVATGLTNAVPVLIDGNGQLGTVNSSRRFKEDIQDMAHSSSGLLRLRPVTYRYKQPYADGSKPIDYGLIAEEVAEVYPDLVVKNSDGEVQTVQYHKLVPMLLNEVQKQNLQIQKQAEIIESQQEQSRNLEARLDALESLLSNRAPAAARQ